MERQITEKELKKAAKQCRLQYRIVEYLIAKVRENQQKSNKMSTKNSNLFPKIVDGSCGWFQCSNTGGRCDKCGKQQWEH